MTDQSRWGSEEELLDQIRNENGKCWEHQEGKPKPRQLYLYKSVEIDSDYGEAELKFLARYSKKGWMQRWLNVLKKFVLMK
jgi:hypothetical protein